MYKDKQKQKEAVLRAVQKHRKGITNATETKVLQGITPKGITDGKGITSIVGHTVVVPPGSPRPILKVTQKDIDALPQHIKDSISKTVNYRLSLGLYNDQEERLERAAVYHAVTGR